MIDIAAIGMGVMGNHHAAVCRQIPGIRLIAFAEIDPPAAELASAELDVPAYADYREMLSDVRPQMVTVAVPASLHEEVVLAALDAGAHVFVEKPMATTMEAGWNMITRAGRLGRHLMAGHVDRFNPTVQALKQQIQIQRIGEIYHVHCQRHAPFPERIKDVGITLDSAIHDIDLLYFLTGQPPSRICAEIHHYLGRENEDALLGTLHYHNGLSASLDVSWISAQRKRLIHVLGEKGSLLADTVSRKLTVQCGANQMVEVPVSDHNPLEQELRAFVHAIRHKTPVPVPPTESLLALELALALLKSGQG